MYFASNIKLLRRRRGRTQEDVAVALDMKRSTLSGYENGVAQPDIQQLIVFSQYFRISIDTLVKIDLGGLSESQLSELEKGYDVFVTGTTLRVLATTVDRDNEENIELVPEQAMAGYRRGFADPEFIKVLPAFQLPFLSRQKKYRSFQIRGDSMLPIPDGSWVTGEFVQNWNFIRNGHAYIILTMEDGIVFKVADNQLKTHKKLVLYSLNPIYEPYEIQVNEIREVWKFVHYISSELPEPNLPRDEVVKTLLTLKQDVQKLKARVEQGKLDL